MRELFGSLLGVPAAAGIAGGLGLIAVTIWNRVRAGAWSAPIRWPHLMMGVGLAGAGASLLGIDLTLVGLR